MKSGVSKTFETKQACSQVDVCSNSTCFRQTTTHLIDQRCFPGAGRSDEFYNHPASTDEGSRRSVKGDDFSGDWSLSPHSSTRLPSASIDGDIILKRVASSSASPNHTVRKWKICWACDTSKTPTSIARKMTPLGR